MALNVDRIRELASTCDDETLPPITSEQAETTARILGAPRDRVKRLVTRAAHGGALAAAIAAGWVGVSGIIADLSLSSDFLAIVC